MNTQAQAFPDILTVEQAADYLQVAPKTVRQWSRIGRLPAAKAGRRWRFRRLDLDDWIARGGNLQEQRQTKLTV